MPESFRPTAPILCLIAAVWMVFSPAITAQFVYYDDSYLVRDNPRLVPPTWQKTAGFWTAPCKQLYTPMAYILWSAVAALNPPVAGGKLRPLPFHLLNIFLHCGAAIFAYLLFNQLTGAVWPAWAGAMFFALHPLQVEPVAWVSGMNNLLCGCLGLAALWQYVRYAKSSADSGRHLALAAVFYAAALLSKPLAVTLPFMAAALDVWIIRRQWRSAIWPLLAAVAMAIPIMVVARLVQPAAEIPSISIPQRLLVAVDAIGFYARKLVLPTNLTIDFERMPQWLLAHRWAAWPGFIVVAGGGLSLFAGQRSPSTRAALAIAFAGFLPVLGLTPFDFQEYSTVACRYAYLPLIGAGLWLAILLQMFPRRLAGLPAIAILAALGFLSFKQSGVWHDSGSLGNQQLRVDPDSSTGHKMLAEWLATSNQPDAAGAEFRFAIARIIAEGRPGEGAIWYDYGNLLLRQGRFDEARRIYSEGLPRAPKDMLALVHNNLGIALDRLGDRAGARSEFRAALNADPKLAQARQNLSRLGPE